MCVEVRHLWLVLLGRQLAQLLGVAKHQVQVLVEGHKSAQRKRRPSHSVQDTPLLVCRAAPSYSAESQPLRSIKHSHACQLSISRERHMVLRRLQRDSMETARRV